MVSHKITETSASEANKVSNMTPALTKICHAFRNLMVSGISKSEWKKCLPGHMKLYDVSHPHRTYTNLHKHPVDNQLNRYAILSSLPPSSSSLAPFRHTLSPALPSPLVKDPLISPLPFYDCPVKSNKDEFQLPYHSPTVISKEDPESTLNEWIIESPLAIQAKNILKIRRRKMNRHRLKKLRKRMRFVRRKELHRRRKKKEKILQEQLQAKIQTGIDFDAEEFVQDKLALARKGGYKIDIFGR
ncbi:aurora kinase A-interacting protein-like isoform X1 [Argonauta hians]